MSLGGPELFFFFVLGGMLALIPASIAARKGRSFGLWFLLGLLFFLPALIAALVISPATPSEALTATVMRAVEEAPGSTQQQLALRAGVDVADVLRALTDLAAAGMVRYEQTGLQFELARQQVPIVQVHPRRA